MSRAVTALILAVVLVPAATGEHARPVLSVAATSASGTLPLTVRFMLDAPNATSWRLDFGDGQFRAAKGRPPATVTHVYRTKGSFVAHLSTVYPRVTAVIPAPKTKVVAPKPSPGTPSKLTGPLVIVGVVPGPATSPRTIQFTLASTFAGDVSSWQLLFGDGQTASGKGVPPASVGHTYAHAGTFRAYLVLSETTADRYARLQVPAKGLSVTVH
jgi:hypothetical protein